MKAGICGRQRDTLAANKLDDLQGIHWGLNARQRTEAIVEAVNLAHDNWRDEHNRVELGLSVFVAGSSLLWRRGETLGWISNLSAFEER